MPDIEEDVMRDLMVRATADLFAPPAATARALRRQRQHRTRGRLLGVTGIAAAAGLAIGTLATVSGSGAHPAPGQGGPGPVQSVRLTAAQKTLYGLSAAAATTRRQAGAYVILREKVTDSKPGKGSETGPRTNIITTATGFSVSHEHDTVSGSTSDPWAPGALNAPPDSLPTLAKLDAMPTSPAALRALFLAQGKQLLAQARAVAKQLAKSGQKIQVPRLTDNDLVFDQAANALWDPRLSPALRAAVYKVLADTPGVTVRKGVADSAGRPAVEISRVSSQGENVETFENPKTGATLESAWAEPSGEVLEDLYLSITYTNHVPDSAYQG
jgi:hypothetical protein